MTAILSDIIVLFGSAIGVATGLMTSYGIIGVLLGWWPPEQPEVIARPYREGRHLPPDHPGHVVPFEGRK